MKLSAFRVDSRAIEQGEWIKPDPDVYGDLEIRTRGFTDTYTDARAARIRRLAMQYQGDPSKIPVAVHRAVTAECLVAHSLLDVRGLSHDDGRAVSFAEFCALIRDADFPDLFVAAVTAASLIGKRRAADLADALGNSSPPSATPCSGADSATA